LEAQNTRKRTKQGKYARTIAEFLKTNYAVCKIDCSGISINAAYNGFNRAIKSQYSEKVFLSRVDDELYIEKL
jgi:hypothetical protein